jgi:lipid II:glycine glycyltransferase (peptidoglycan interpeptide bridge formation enzyme)
VYADPATKDELLDEMVRALTEKLDNRVLYIEVSHMSQKMMGYKQLKQAGYYPVNWMSIHNSLHRRAPEERITEKLQRTIDNVHKRGLKTEVVKTEEDFKAFSRLLRKHNILKPKRFIPDNIFFRKVMQSGYGELFVTKYHGWVIGCAAVAYSEGDAYLWYSAFRRKTFHNLHPDTMVVWDVMKHAYDKGCQHMRFMDVGLPYGKNPYREFILKFGGKEQSTYRWFRFSIKWVNKLLAWIYRE